MKSRSHLAKKRGPSNEPPNRSVLLVGTIFKPSLWPASSDGRSCPHGHSCGLLCHTLAWQFNPAPICYNHGLPYQSWQAVKGCSLSAWVWWPGDQISRLHSSEKLKRPSLAEQAIIPRALHKKTKIYLQSSCQKGLFSSPGSSV